MNVLVTGGAGFIGSHLVDRLVESGAVVRVLDDLSTGLSGNLNDNAEFVEGSIGDGDVVRHALKGVETVFHQAARTSVARSVEDPLSTNLVNVHGTLVLLQECVESGVRRFVHASSSSVYGGAAEPPTAESAPCAPKSPYAVSKLAAEHYCRVFAALHGIETVVLRYFNVFGPRQRPDSAYAAVIPRFIDDLRSYRPPTVHGDGSQARDFTYVDDVVSANLAAASTAVERCDGRVYNVAGGRPRSLVDLLDALGSIMGMDIEPAFTEPRAGDIRRSHADVSAARRDLGFDAVVDFEDGLRRTIEWFSSR